MADIADVEQAVADTIATVLYPQGSTQSSVVGVTCRIYRGWPNSSALNSDLSAGVVNVTITADADIGKTTTRYLSKWGFTSTAPGLTASLIGTTVLIGGTAQEGDVIGALVDGLAYVYRVIAGDTPNLVAANLCSSIQAARVATVAGSGVTIPGAGAITVRIVCDNTGYREGRRQEKDIRIACWCADPMTRDSVAAAIDLPLAQSAFLSLPDATSARILYRNSATYDQSQNALLYRRDLCYSVEYPTVISRDFSSMLFGAAAINGQIKFC